MYVELDEKDPKTGETYREKITSHGPFGIFLENKFTPYSNPYRQKPLGTITKRKRVPRYEYEVLEKATELYNNLPEDTILKYTSIAKMVATKFSNKIMHAVRYPIGRHDVGGFSWSAYDTAIDTDSTMYLITEEERSDNYQNELGELFYEPKIKREYPIEQLKTYRNVLQLAIIKDLLVFGEKDLSRRHTYGFIYDWDLAFAATSGSIKTKDGIIKYFPNKDIVAYRTKILNKSNKRFISFNDDNPWWKTNVGLEIKPKVKDKQ